MSLVLSGIGVSRGVAIGEAHVLQRGDLEILEYAIPRALLDAEVERFRGAVASAKNQLKAIRSQIPGNTPPDIVAFIDTHLLMLADETLADAPAKLIRARACNAEWALKLQRDALVTVFEEMDDPYLRTRKDDVDHVVNRIQRILLNQEVQAPTRIDTPLRGCLVLADDLTPADAILMQHQGVAGFVTEYGGPLSHTAIIARNLRIPAVVGVAHVRRLVRDGELVVIDGAQGIVLAEPDERTLRHFRSRQRDDRRQREALAGLRCEPAITRDGRPILLEANIELAEDTLAAVHAGAAGVGLYRTESLFMNRSEPPGEEEQLGNYLSVLRGLQGAPLTIRTLDLGADKRLDDRDARPVCSNPALGLRAIRLCLKDLALFRPQLRAILRTSAHGPVRLMVPMLSNLRELTQVLQLVDESKRELTAQGLVFNPDIPVGGMIEVPAAAIAAHLFARSLDFLSIGTNDLIQYTLAIDRVDNEVNYLYDPLHPAVLQLIAHVVQVGTKAGIPVAMCGEMAGDVRYTRLLLGLGLAEFSMYPATLLEVKSVVNRSHCATLAKLARRVLKCTDAESVTALLEEMNRDL